MRGTGDRYYLRPLYSMLNLAEELLRDLDNPLRCEVPMIEFSVQGVELRLLNVIQHDSTVATVTTNGAGSKHPDTVPVVTAQEV